MVLYFNRRRKMIFPSSTRSNRCPLFPLIIKIRHRLIVENTHFKSDHELLAVYISGIHSGEIVNWLLRYHYNASATCFDAIGFAETAGT